MAKSSKLEADTCSYTSVGTPRFVDEDHEAQDVDAEVTVQISECDAELAKHMSSCRRAGFLSAAAVAVLALVSLAALARHFRNGATNPFGQAGINTMVELDMAGGFCPFPVDGGCLEQGYPDFDCCALPGDGGCAAGFAFTQGPQCFQDGAVATCCKNLAPPPPDGGAFCWLVTAGSGGEADLVTDHFAKRRSIFACNDWTVFSDTWSLPPVPVTNIGSLSSKMGPWGSFLNAEVFLRAWDAFIKEGKYARHPWTVKVDADTVFFYWRFLYHVRGVDSQDPVWYRSGEELLGALEVFSLGAVDAFATKGRSVCRWGIEESGEDGFIDHCMQQLGAAVKIDGSLLKSSLDPGACGDDGIVAFHPFKDLGSYSACQSIAIQ